MEQDGGKQTRRTWDRLAWRLAGTGLLAATAGIHLDLYLTGYRTIPTIGALFLLQVISAFALALAVLGAPRGPILAAAAASGAGFCVSTVGGYLLSIWIGLFGFQEVRTTAGVVAGGIEVAAVVVLGGLALIELGAVTSWRPGKTRGRLPATATLSIVGMALLAPVVVSGGSGRGGIVAAGGPATTALSITMIGGVAVLTDANGLTLYWFAPDSPTTSRCTGTCVAYWPPVIGKPRVGPGVVGRTGWFRRGDGSVQATYDGHPLYTYVGDSHRGDANGNDIDLNGGRWYEMTASGRIHR